MTDKFEMEVKRLEMCSKRHDIKNSEGVGVSGCDVCLWLDEGKYSECLEHFDNVTVNYPDYVYIKEVSK